jgi:hypothetical protein
MRNQTYKCTLKSQNLENSFYFQFFLCLFCKRSNKFFFLQVSPTMFFKISSSKIRFSKLLTIRRDKLECLPLDKYFLPRLTFVSKAGGAYSGGINF